MADDDQARPTQSNPTATKTEPQRYDVDALAERARSEFGVRPAVVRAVIGQQRRQTHTLEEAASLIEKAVKRAPKPDNEPDPEDGS